VIWERQWCRQVSSSKQVANPVTVLSPQGNDSSYAHNVDVH
jgi:hypothetical protein